jgi:hypothetical protein
VVRREAPLALQESPPGGGSPPRRSSGGKTSAAIPDCPQCERRMTIKQVAPVLFASELDDVTYGCETCATEAKRTVRRI